MLPNSIMLFPASWNDFKLTVTSAVNSHLLSPVNLDGNEIWLFKQIKHFVKMWRLFVLQNIAL